MFFPNKNLVCKVCHIQRLTVLELYSLQHRRVERDTLSFMIGKSYVLECLVLTLVLEDWEH